jgi:hypothetical protein
MQLTSCAAFNQHSSSFSNISFKVLQALSLHIQWRTLVPPDNCKYAFFCVFLTLTSVELMLLNMEFLLSRMSTAVLKIIALVLLSIANLTQAQQFEVTRLNGALPIVSKKQFELAGASAEEGANINGPSVIRIPQWVPRHRRAAPNAEYYMYFGHHQGRYIRLAWAEKVEGPWQLYNIGPDIADGMRGVLDIGDDRKLELSKSLSILRHIASPDVHINSESKRIVMYFHGPVMHGKQKCRVQRTFVATSPWGLNFSADIHSQMLSASYLRVFEFDGVQQGIAGSNHYIVGNDDEHRLEGEELDFCSNSWQGSPANFLNFTDIRDANVGGYGRKKLRIRHLALYRKEAELFVFFTVRGHSPERILMTQVYLGEECWACAAPRGSPVEIMRAEEIWEGSGVKPSPSKRGAQFDLENALRDPFIFEDEGKLYLFYVGGGEQAIGLALLRKIEA